MLKWIVLILVIAVLGLVIFTPGRDLLRYLYWRLSQSGHYEQGYVVSGQSRIFYQAFGEGKPLILLHGGATQSEIFISQIPMLSAHFRVIAIDSRGQGRSTRGISPLTYRVMANDVITVMDALGLGKSAILGWSDGGITGLVLAVSQPERVGRLVAVSANYSPAGIQSEDGDIHIEPPGLLPYLFYQVFSPHPERWDTLSRELTQLWATLPELKLEELSHISSPVLLIGGENDLVSTAHLREMQAAIPGSRLLIVPEAGHNLLLGYGEEINDALLAFLSDGKNE